MLADSRRTQGRRAAISRTGARHGAFRLIRTGSRRYHHAGMDLLTDDLPMFERRVHDALAQARPCDGDVRAHAGATL
jgi:hypothetical protein